LRNAIGRTSCGRHHALPPVVAGHRWASLVRQYVEQQKTPL
jgi:hypothetical protein